MPALPLNSAYFSPSAAPSSNLPLSIPPNGIVTIDVLLNKLSFAHQELYHAFNLKSMDSPDTSATFRREFKTVSQTLKKVDTLLTPFHTLDRHAYISCSNSPIDPLAEAAHIIGEQLDRLQNIWPAVTVEEAGSADRMILWLKLAGVLGCAAVILAAFICPLILAGTSLSNLLQATAVVIVLLACPTAGSLYEIASAADHLAHAQISLPSGNPAIMIPSEKTPDEYFSHTADLFRNIQTACLTLRQSLENTAQERQNTIHASTAPPSSAHLV